MIGDVSYDEEGEGEGTENSLMLTLNLPTALVNLWVPPAPGSRPMLTSGRPNLLEEEAKIRSHYVMGQKASNWHQARDGKSG